VSDFTPKERELLQLLRDDWGPSADAKAAARAGIERRLREGAGASEPPPTPLLRSPLAIGAGVVVLGLLVGGLAALKNGPDAEAPTPPRATVTAPAATTPRAVDTAPSPAPTMEAVSVDSLPVAPAPSSPKTATPARTQAAPSTAPADTLGEELALLKKAQSALRAGAPGDALSALSEHAARFPNGALREERMTLRVLALCDRGDVTAARDARDELARTAPGSSHLQRLESSCVKP
jgi:hypothetical protein